MRNVVVALALLIPGAAVLSAEPPKPAGERVVIDLAGGSFRAFVGWKTPTLVAADGKLKPLLEPKRKDLKDEDRKPVPVRMSERPATNWIAVDFDDSGWIRAGDRTALDLNSSEGDRVCLRGTFFVADPAQVTDLGVRLTYIGGAVVYVNGAELQRGHLSGPASADGADLLAMRYADDAYVTPDNKLRPTVDVRYPASIAAYLAGRVRELPARGLTNGVSIPASMLRPGVNVVAIDVRAAPINELAVEKSVGSVTWTGSVQWAHAVAASARLTASAGPDVISGRAPISGIEIATSQPVETVDATQRMLPAARIYPIRLIGTRNGTFSGKVVLSSAGSITNLRASVTDLSPINGKQKIPAAAIQVRWAERTTPRVSWITHWDPLGWCSFDRLLGEFPANIPVATLTPDRRRLAVAPVWVTVHVPADAAAGEYEGVLQIEAMGTGLASFAVPVRLKVNDWRLPDPKQFAIHQDIYQSPDSVAQWYDVPLWSDRHFALMGKSLQAFQEVGNKLCIVNLVVDSRTLGNTESMVRWVKKPGGGYDYDFTIAEKYMDLYGKICGKPGILRLDAWQRARDSANPWLSVSVLDPATGKVEPMAQPPYATPENEAFWRPVFDELRKRLEKRGWLDVAAVSWVNYQHGPGQINAGIVDVYQHLWPDGKWMQTTHQNPREYPGAAKGVSMPIAYSEYVWGAGMLYNPDAGGKYPRPWKAGAARIELGFPRYGVGFIGALNDGSPLAAYRLVTEAALQGNLRGLGFLGGDFWPIRPLRPGDNRHVGVGYGLAGMDRADGVVSCFSPGPDGTCFNGRMEMFREGVQAVEAMLFLQRAAEEGKIADALARRIDDLLNERARTYLRVRDRWHVFECSGWQGEDDRLFALCAEVARAGSR
jgi:hypothetical protein